LAPSCFSLVLLVSRAIVGDNGAADMALRNAPFQNRDVSLPVFFLAAGHDSLEGV